MKKKEPGFVCFEKRLFLRRFPIRPAGLAARKNGKVIETL